MKSARNNISLITCAVCSLLISFQILSGTKDKAISWDVFGYYLYLPAVLYQHDPALKDTQFAEEARLKYDLSPTLYQIHQLEDGSRVIQYSCGFAVIALPAFVAGHIVAAISGAPQDGFSSPYQVSLVIWILIIAIIGLFYVRKILLHFFTDKLTACLLLLLVAGTNYFIQTTLNLTSQHTVLFTIQAMLIWNLIQWTAAWRGKNLLVAALLFGLACLIRPTECLLIFLILFWGNAGIKSAAINWWNNITKRPMLIAGVVCVVILSAMPQLLYWKIASGHYFVNSYANPGEGLDLNRPHLLSFLFSFRKGWLLYTPLMVVALAGILIAYRQNRNIFVALIVYLSCYIYVSSCWSTWWYAGSFSQRSMIQAYPVLILALGISLNFFLQKKSSAIVVVCCVFGLVALNIFQSWQYSNGIIDSSRMTRGAYAEVFLKTSKPPNFEQLLVVDRGVAGIPENKFPWKYQTKSVVGYDFGEHMHGIMTMPANDEFLDVVSIPYKNLTHGEHCWIEVEMMVYCDSVLTDDLLIVSTMDHDGNYGYVTKGFEPGVFRARQWNRLSLSYLTPHVRSDSDKLAIYIWKRKKTDILIDYINVDVLVLNNESAYE